MNAYLAPIAAALVGAVLTALFLGAVRLSRLLSRRRAQSQADSGGRQPEPVRHSPDPTLPFVAHRTVAIALLLGLTAIFFYSATFSSVTGIEGAPVTATVLVLLVSWMTAGGPR